MKKFLKKNSNITIVTVLLSIIIGLLGYINNQNIKSQTLNRLSMDKLIINTTLLKENDIKQDFKIMLNAGNTILNKEDIKCLETDIAKLQNIWYKYNNQNSNSKD